VSDGQDLQMTFAIIAYSTRVRTERARVIVGVSRGGEVGVGGRSELGEMFSRGLSPDLLMVVQTVWTRKFWDCETSSTG
jgi:hypothetical protein